MVTKFSLITYCFNLLQRIKNQTLSERNRNNCRAFSRTAPDWWWVDWYLVGPKSPLRALYLQHIQLDGDPFQKENSGPEGRMQTSDTQHVKSDDCSLKTSVRNFVLKRSQKRDIPNLSTHHSLRSPDSVYIWSHILQKSSFVLRPTQSLSTRNWNKSNSGFSFPFPKGLLALLTYYKGTVCSYYFFLKKNIINMGVYLGASIHISTQLICSVTWIDQTNQNPCKNCAYA